MEVIRGIAAIIAANTIRKLIVLKRNTVHSHSFKASQVAQWSRICLPIQESRKDAGSISGSEIVHGVGNWNFIILSWRVPGHRSPVDYSPWGTTNRTQLSTNVTIIVTPFYKVENWGPERGISDFIQFKGHSSRAKDWNQGSGRQILWSDPLHQTA